MATIRQQEQPLNLTVVFTMDATIAFILNLSIPSAEKLFEICLLNQNRAKHVRNMCRELVITKECQFSKILKENNINFNKQIQNYPILWQAVAINMRDALYRGRTSPIVCTKMFITQKMQKYFTLISTHYIHLFSTNTVFW